MIYCVYCNTLVPAVQSDNIFRTGYYKVTVPLGLCKSCELKGTGDDNQEPDQSSTVDRLACMA